MTPSVLTTTNCPGSFWADILRRADLLDAAPCPFTRWCRHGQGLLWSWVTDEGDAHLLLDFFQPAAVSCRLYPERQGLVQQHLGRFTRARAMATALRWPPVGASGLCGFQSLQALTTSSGIAVHADGSPRPWDLYPALAGGISGQPLLRIRRPKATFSNTFMWETGISGTPC